MKKQILLALIIILGNILAHGQISVNTDGSAPDPSAGLEIKFTDKGFLPPRLSTAERFSILNPATGLTIYNTDLSGLEFYKGTAGGWFCPCLGTSTVWTLSGNGGTSGSANFLGTTGSTTFILRVNNSMTGRVDQFLHTTNWGYQSFYTSSSGGPENTVMGHLSNHLISIVVSNNTAFGAESLYSNNGNDNTSVGWAGMHDNSSGNSNTSLGTNSLNHSVHGHNNVAIGNSAVGSENSQPSIVASNNTGFGRQVMYQFASASNTAIGKNALYEGYSNMNTAVGINAMQGCLRGSQTAVGANALKADSTGEGNSAIGAFSIQSHPYSYDNSAFGYMSLAGSTHGSGNSAFGSHASENALNASFSDNNAAGFNALKSNSDGDWECALGAFAMQNTTGGHANTAIGAYSLFSNITGMSNTAIGEKSMYFNTTGELNMAEGYQSLYSNTTGSKNTALGYQALANNSTGSFNTAVGNDAGPSLDWLNNTSAFGSQAWVTVSNSVVLGNSAVSWIGGQVNYSSPSDKRFKKNVKKNVPGLSFILRLNPLTYTWDIQKLNRYRGIPDSLNNNSIMREAIARQESVVYTGFLAQQVEEAATMEGFDFSGLTRPANGQTPYSLSYASFTVPLVKAEQELSRKNTRQQKQLTEIQSERRKLEHELDKLRDELMELERTIKGN